MFEGVTYEVLLESMLNRIPDTFDKRQGSIIYDALAPVAAELAQVYIDLDVYNDESFADTMSIDSLVRKCAERGIYQKEATKAVWNVKFNEEAIVEPGLRLTDGTLTFVTVQGVGTLWKVECEEYGIVGNVAELSLVPIDNIEGFDQCLLTSINTPGTDDEDEEELRDRYFNSLNERPFGGNKADYIMKTNELSGVGATKVIPVWDGPGTVKLVILSDEYKSPSDGIVEYVQNKIDPIGGTGDGIAPVGHTVTVVAATNEIINVVCDITYQTGISFADLKSYIEQVIDDYFLELNKTWEKSEELVVRVSQIEYRLLNIDGIIDVGNTLLNNSTNNIVIPNSSIPKRGVVSEAT